jgi:hypothetical protein
VKVTDPTASAEYQSGGRWGRRTFDLLGQVSNSLETIVFGLVGGILGRFVAVKDER